MPHDDRVLDDAAAWAARTGRRPDADALEAACDIARAWQEAAIAPLRAVVSKPMRSDLPTPPKLAEFPPGAASPV